MSDGIIISNVGVDVDNITSKSQVLMSTKDPFMKLDRTKNVSFQNISLYFLHNPPDPAPGGTPITTKVYSFEHGYPYTPAVWVLGQDVQKPAAAFTPDYYQDGFIVAANTSDGDQALLMVKATNSNVNFYIKKSVSTLFNLPVDLTGMRLLLRVYVFVDDLQ